MLLIASPAGAWEPPPLILPPPPPGSTCVFIQRGAAGNAFESDVSIGNGTWASGAYPYTWTGPSPYDHRSIHKFDSSAVPAGVQVVLATFSVYVGWNDKSSQVRLHRITQPWEELTVNSQSFGAWSWDPAVIASFDPNGVGHKTIDVTGLVQGWKSGQYPDFGLLMEEDPVELHGYFGSESSTAVMRPSLYVCYVAGGPCATSPDGAGCDDGNLCTVNEACQLGQCAGGQPVACAALDDCHEAGVCDPTTGQCTAPEKQDGAPCNDGDLCTTGDGCAAGLCVGSTPVSCVDSNECTTDTCDPETGCLNNAVSCDDGNACTADGCDAADGCAHEPLVCDDGDACTADLCDPASGCAIAPVSCDDGNACTTDGCDAVTGCSHTPSSCDDGSLCTVDGCDPAAGCTHLPDATCGGTCDVSHANCDGDPANGCEATLGTVQTCGGCGGVCAVAHGMPVCDLGACGIAACDPGWGNCDCSLANGCETDLSADPESCGVCGLSCAAAGGTGQCVQGTCAMPGGN